MFCSSVRSRFKGYIQISNWLWHLCQRKAWTTGNDELHAKWDQEEDLCVLNTKTSLTTSPQAFLQPGEEGRQLASVSARAGPGGPGTCDPEGPAAPHFLREPPCSLLMEEGSLAKSEGARLAQAHVVRVKALSASAWMSAAWHLQHRLVFLLPICLMPAI